MLQVQAPDPFIWQLQAGMDGKLYGVTYPNGKAFAYDPVSDIMIDLGTMKEGIQYARSLTLTEHEMYVGLGPQLHLVRYELITGEKREISIEGCGEKGFVFGIATYKGKLFYNAERTLHVMNSETGQTLYSLQDVNRVSPPSSACQQYCYFKQGGSLYRYDLERDTYAAVLELPNNLIEMEARAYAWITPLSGRMAGRCVLAVIGVFTESYMYDPEENEIEQVTLEVEPNPVPYQRHACIQRLCVHRRLSARIHGL